MISDLLDFWDLKFNPKATEQIAPPLFPLPPLVFPSHPPFLAPHLFTLYIPAGAKVTEHLLGYRGGAWISSGYRGGLESDLDIGGLGFVKQ